MATTCASCGTANRPSARFCDACGAPLAARPAGDAVARKVVTIVFADLIGSTSLHERLDPESVSRLMDRYYRAVRAPIEAHGGTVVQLLGDGVMCAFGVPRVAEDDAIRAVRAAVAMQRAYREFACAERAVLGDVGLRVAVNTGEVVVSDEHAAGIGDPLNVAARLQQEAKDGDVLVGEATQRLVGDIVTLERFGTFALKGRADAVTAYRVVSLDRPTGAATAAFVGRDDELQHLLALYDAACAEPGPRLGVVLGSPGLGKSRLLAELPRRLGARATVLAARCDAAGGTTFAPVADSVRMWLGLDGGAARAAVRAAVGRIVPGEEAERIAAGTVTLLAGTPASPDETFFVIRRLLAAAASARPVVLTIDDAQWADQPLLDLAEHLVQWSAGVPLLVLVAARPELRDVRPSLASPGMLVTEVLTLGGLDAGAATRLAANAIGADELPAAIVGRVLAVSEGNPLFVGELVRMLVHDGVLRREGGRWTAGVELASLEMPPTIQALLAARIERLRPEERTVLERAAVVGRQFSRAAVAHLVPDGIGDLDERLESLRRSELVDPDAGAFLGEPGLRFHHGLVRDAAYRRVLKGTRADLHVRVADWLAERTGDAVEHDEAIGWHLEQAHQHLRELGPVDARGRALGERAAARLGSAGRRALGGDDVRTAANLLGRALERLDADAPGRAALLLDRCEALLAAGDVGPAADAVSELDRIAAGSERLCAWHTCFRVQLAILTDPRALRAGAESVAAAAAALASLDDAAGEAKGYAVYATALARLGEIGACEVAFDRALAAARRAGDRRRANAVLAGSPVAALWGPSPVTRASGRCLDVVRVLRLTDGVPAVEAVALRCQAVLEALRGRIDAARRLIATSRAMVEELGILPRVLEADTFAGVIELLEGDAGAAGRLLRGSYEGLRALGLRVDAAQAGALLGRALLALGRDGDAERLSHESEALAGDDLKAAIAWRGVRAEALARRDALVDAVACARAAVAIAAATDALLDHADARLALAVVLRAAGRNDEAQAEEARAIELWRSKGATALIERMRRDHADGTAEASDGDVATPGGARDRPATGAPPGRTAAWVTNAATRATVGSPGESREIVATRGDRLALVRTRAQDAESGPDRAERLTLVQVDEGVARTIDFPPDDLDGAVAKLDARYAGGEAAAHGHTDMTRAFLAAFAARDWDAFAGLLAPDLVVIDHRVLGWEPLRGPAAYVDALRSLAELAPDVRLRLDHVIETSEHGIIYAPTWIGSREGGAFDAPSIIVAEVDAQHRIRRFDQYDVDRVDEARARFEAIRPGADQSLHGEVRRV